MGQQTKIVGETGWYRDTGTRGKEGEGEIEDINLIWKILV